MTTGSAVPDDSAAPNKTGRRSARNLLIKPRQQLRIIAMLVGGSAGILAIFATTFVYLLSQTLRSVAIAHDMDEVITRTLLNLLYSSAFIVVGLAALMGAGIIWATLLLTHRMYGPMTPIIRTLEQLKAGNFSVRGKLRAKDEFQEVMTAVNELAEALEKRATREFLDGAPASKKVNGVD